MYVAPKIFWPEVANLKCCAVDVAIVVAAAAVFVFVKMLRHNK